MKTSWSSHLQPSGKPLLSRVIGAIAAGLIGLAAGHGLRAEVVIPSGEPADQTSCLGGCLTYTVNATGTPPLSYEWRIYTNTTQYRVVSGEFSNTIVLCDVPVNNWRVRVVVTDGDGQSAESRLARMIIMQPPILTQQTIGGSAVAGEGFTQTVTASGTPLYYQWYFNGQPMPGKTGSSLGIANVQSTNEGDYHVVVSNACNLVSSETNRLTVGPDATFTRVTTGPVVTDLGNSATGTVADQDGDGDLDLFVSRYLNGLSTLYLNKGDGTFTGVTNEISPVSRGEYGGGIWADFDNDGAVDFFVTDPVGVYPSYFAFNDGAGHFTTMEFEPQSPWATTMIDYNHDGLLDLFMTRGYAATVNRMYRNLSGRSFQLATQAEVGDLLTLTPTYGTAAWADYDDDGAMDLFAPSSVSQNGCQMYHNSGSGRFTLVTNQVTQDALNGQTAG